MAKKMDDFKRKPKRLQSHNLEQPFSMMILLQFFWFILHINHISISKSYLTSKTSNILVTQYSYNSEKQLTTSLAAVYRPHISHESSAVYIQYATLCKTLQGSVEWWPGHHSITRGSGLGWGRSQLSCTMGESSVGRSRSNWKGERAHRSPAGRPRHHKCSRTHYAWAGLYPNLPHNRNWRGGSFWLVPWRGRKNLFRWNGLDLLNYWGPLHLLWGGLLTGLHLLTLYTFWQISCQWITENLDFLFFL